MKGLVLSEKFYRNYGQSMIHEKFTTYEDKIAVGLVGEGSECLGYDDIFSMDHDFGPGFCLWLTDQDYETIGPSLQKAYDKLPQNYMGYKRIQSQQAKQRVGVMRITDFYRKFIGHIDNFSDICYWLQVPEHLLTCATNGQVFEDPLGEFTRIRTILCKYYPEDIRIKKIAARFALMAQSGQYNYYRSMLRNEYVSARLSLDIFIRESMSLFFLLNKTYMPYYKWAFHGLGEWPLGKEIAPLIQQLALTPITDEMTIKHSIEEICQAAIMESKRQGLTTLDCDFLEAHTLEIMSHITNPKIKSLHVMYG